MPPLCRETQSLGQQMLNAPLGINGLKQIVANSTGKIFRIIGHVNTIDEFFLTLLQNLGKYLRKVRDINILLNWCTQFIVVRITNILLARKFPEGNPNCFQYTFKMVYKIYHSTHHFCIIIYIYLCLFNHKKTVLKYKL